MDKPTPVERIEAVLDAISNIRDFIRERNVDYFLENIKLQSAVMYKFLVIGEAIRNIDDSILSRYDYPWHIPRSFRNYIIHEYHGIKLERVYFAATDLERLKTVMEEILQKEF